MDERDEHFDYFAPPRRPATPAAPAPAAVADVPATALVRELAGRLQWRSILPFLRRARVAIPLLLLVLGSVARMGGAVWERLPFVGSAPVSNVGANGKLDVIQPGSLFVESALLRFSTTEYDGSYFLAQNDPGEGRALAGYSEGHGIQVNGYDRGAFTSTSIWPDRIRDDSFRTALIENIGKAVGDEPTTISILGNEGYLFHTRKYPSSAVGSDFIVMFYENQVLQIGGVWVRETKQFAHSILQAQT